MKALTILLWLVLMNLPQQGWSIDSCSECVLGIWDDPALTRNHGEIIVGQPKDIYVGIKFAEGFNEVIGIALSVAGLRAFLVLGVTAIVPTMTNCDNLSAPADTSAASYGIGGCTFGWYDCLAGDQALLRVSILSFSSVTNGLLQVKRHYPPLPDARTPVFFQCNDPLYTPTRVKGGLYILNWDGDPTVGVDDAAWSRLKQLYR